MPEQGAEAMTFRLCCTSDWAVGGSRMSESVKFNRVNRTSSYTLSLFFLHCLLSSSRVRSTFQANAVSTTYEKCLVRKTIPYSSS